MSDNTRFFLTDKISSLPEQDWDRISGSSIVLSHAYLSAFETSGSVGGQTGWHGQHLLMERDHELVAAVPLYAKLHSYGEYVFDWAWADAYARNGLNYYPKLLAAVPFSPIPGSRLLGTNEHDRQALVEGLLEVAHQSDFSSLHLLFGTETEMKWLATRGFMIRQGVQFQWFNREYADFDAFLAQLNHEKRKKIRQERRRAAAHGLTYEWLDGDRASEQDWLFFYRCYATTYALHRSSPYLSPEFFLQLAERAPNGVRLLVARRHNEAVASAFFLSDGTVLYGRYWGATENLPFLHFELCYYRAIEYCIDHGFTRFEGGAQGEHKLARGLQPVPTYSAHWLRDPRFADAVERFLARERNGVEAYLDELNDRLPFRQAVAP